MRNLRRRPTQQMSDTFTTLLQSSPSRPSHLRQVNARGLLHLLRRHNPCSKADLVRLSGLSAPTVSSGILHLENLGLVQSIGDGESSGGRPPELLRFNAGHGFVAAADIGGTRLRMMLADLNGTVQASWSTILPADSKTPQAICALIHEGLKAMCHEVGASTDKVMHLTAGAPGITNVADGVVLSAPNLTDWNDVRLRDMLNHETGIPVIVENDTNLAAVGEHWRGAAEDIDNFVFVALGTGVGAGIFLRGQLHHGAQWCAGEVGYYGVRGMARETMHVRETGQLERTIGGIGIETHWREILLRHPERNIPEASSLHASQIFDLARDGDPLAIEVLHFVATLLSDIITDIALFLNPSIVVLGGGVGSHPELCRLTQTILQQHEFAQPQLRSSALGTQAQLFGALSLSVAAAESYLLL
jgi:glucokinase